MFSVIYSCLVATFLNGLAEKFMNIFKTQLHSFKLSQSHGVVTHLIFDNKNKDYGSYDFRMVLTVMQHK